MWKIRNPGFTLIELLISIGVIAVLSAGVVALIGQGPAQGSRDARRQADLEKVASALELYRNDLSTYPPCSPVGTGCQANSTNIPALTTAYIATFPADPLAARQYMYRPYDSTGGTCNGLAANRCVTYSLCTALEKNTSAVSGLPNCASAGCGSTCSYRIINP